MQVTTSDGVPSAFGGSGMTRTASVVASGKQAGVSGGFAGSSTTSEPTTGRARRPSSSAMAPPCRWSAGNNSWDSTASVEVSTGRDRGTAEEPWEAGDGSLALCNGAGKANRSQLLQPLLRQVERDTFTTFGRNERRCETEHEGKTQHRHGKDDTGHDHFEQRRPALIPETSAERSESPRCHHFVLRAIPHSRFCPMWTPTLWRRAGDRFMKEAEGRRVTRHLPSH
jgi:hypothetical protein